MSKTHHFDIQVTWTGNTGTGTSSYTSYERSHILHKENHETINCSADKAFRGDNSKYNPEELLIASIAACHMLWYLHFCADAGIQVISYCDSPVGTLLQTENGSGKFTEVILKPIIQIHEPSMHQIARELHHKAHEYCFIANSCNFEIKINPTIIT